jgi:hypothetical protein
MSGTSHCEMHREHTRWRADDDLWRDELAMWERAIDHAVKEIPQIEKALRSHAESLRQHAASIRLYEQEFTTHEHALAEYERGETPQALIELAQTHRGECDHHGERRKKHEELKTQQHALMAKWNLLFTALFETSLRSAT